MSFETIAAANAAGTSSAKDTMRTEPVRLASASSSAEVQPLGVGLSAWWRAKAARMTTNMCTSIAAPERDAASDRGINEMKGLIEIARYAPSRDQRSLMRTYRLSRL